MRLFEPIGSFGGFLGGNKGDKLKWEEGRGSNAQKGLGERNEVDKMDGEVPSESGQIG